MEFTIFSPLFKYVLHPEPVFSLWFLLCRSSISAQIALTVISFSDVLSIATEQSFRSGDVLAVQMRLQRRLDVPVCAVPCRTEPSVHNGFPALAMNYIAQNHKLRNVFDCLRKLPTLGHMKSTEYHDRDKKNVAYETLLPEYKGTFPEATQDNVKKNFNSLMTNYRKELKNHFQPVKSGSSTDDIYEPTLWYYDEMVFLQDQDSASDSQSNMDSQSTIRSVVWKMIQDMQLYISKLSSRYMTDNINSQQLSWTPSSEPQQLSYNQQTVNYSQQQNEYEQDKSLAQYLRLN
ncbi:hypothetical protein FQA39_LY07228 [Lamprigera yunnana]|nr:hypothetical protein FQA39_LY07228 [Lamprigera yunnana]